MDGDSRTHTGLTTEAAIKEAESYDWREKRREIFRFYMATPKDPAVYAYEHDSKKTKWATPTRTTVQDLVTKTSNSIRNQTLHIGIAHSHGHAALVMADLLGGRGNKAQALMMGHYEEQLAGLSDGYFNFYEALSKKQVLGDFNWFLTLMRLNQDPNGIAHTLEDWKAFYAAHQVVDSYMSVSRNSELTGDMRNTDGTINIEQSLKVVAAGLYRELSKGNLGSPLLRYVMETGLYAVLTHGTRPSMVVQILWNYIQNVHAYVDSSKFPGGDDIETI